MGQWFFIAVPCAVRAVRLPGAIIGEKLVRCHMGGRRQQAGGIR